MTEVSLHETVLRDGIQKESPILPLSLKLEMLRGLIDAGLKHIQVASFVNPKKVPQMADAEAFVQALPSDSKCEFSALILNERGLDRALATSLTCFDLSFSCSETHSKKNVGMSYEQARQQMHALIKKAKSRNRKVRLGLQCVFSCAYEGAVSEEKVVNLCREFLDLGLDYLSLADSTGMAIPLQIRSLIGSIKEFCQVPLILHLHDTRGMAVANLLAAFEMGVTHFDTSLGGSGGCPYIPRASGNVATEDVVYLFKRMGIPTGLCLEKLARITKTLEDFLQKSFPGKLHPLVLDQSHTSRL